MRKLRLAVDVSYRGVVCGLCSYLQLLALHEPLESSPGEFAGPARLVLSTLAMIMSDVANTPITSATTHSASG